MPDEPRDVRSLWQKQETDDVQISVDELRRKASAFQKRIRRRNIREYAAAVLVIVAFSWFFVVSHELVPRISFALIVLSTFWVVYNLHRRGSVKAAPADMGRANSIQFFRGELERQRDLLNRIWSWYLGPFIPGMAILIAFNIVKNPRGKRLFTEVYAVFVVLIFWGVGYMNKRGARRLDRQIEELKEMEKTDE
jgi:small-conductance mechanosensitive channel